MSIHLLNTKKSTFKTAVCSTKYSKGSWD